LGEKVQLLQGDITKLHVDVIVNAANALLLGGGGVDGAIHKGAGIELLNECKLLNGCKIGEAIITNAYNLPSRKIIHTVGPIWNGGNNNEEVLLSNCYKNSLKLAKKYKLKTIAFPGISTGAYNYPIDKACKIAYDTIISHKDFDYLSKILLVCFNDDLYSEYLKYTSP